MSRILVLALIFFPLLAPQAGAETITLTLDEAVQRAIDQSFSLKKNTVDLAQAEYSARRLWSEIFPSISMSAGLTFLPSTPLFTGAGFSYNSDALSYALNLGLSLSLNPSIKSSMNRIELAYRAQLLSYETACKQLEIQVTKNFLSLITMKQNLLFMEESLRLAENKLASDTIARRNGLLNELTWLNSQLSVETARYNLSYADGAYRNALGEFLALLGMETVADIDFMGTVDIVQIFYDPEQLILEYLPKRPDMISLRQTIERLELGKTQTALASRFPTLSLSTQWRGTPETGSGLGAPFADSVTGSITLNIPVDSWIPGTRQDQTIRAANAEVEKAYLDLQSAETSAKTQIRSLILNLENTWESLGIARMRVGIAERTVEATELGFRNGLIEFRELEDRRNDLTDARQRLLQGELSYQTLLLDLAAALNVEWRALTKLEVSLGPKPEASWSVP